MSSGEEDPVAWLRRVIEADLVLARRLAARWIVPAGQMHAGQPIWPAPSVSALDVFQGDDPDVNAGLDLITMCSPAYVVARCETELAILDLHQPTWGGCSPGWQECQECGPNNDPPGLLAMPGEGESWWPCRTVRLLMSGYRSRPGYRSEWVPTPPVAPAPGP